MWLRKSTGNKLLDYFFYYCGGTIELMTPTEYLSRCISISSDFTFAVNNPSAIKIEKIIKLVDSQEIKLPAPFLSERFKCQDGIHRMTSLYHLYGDNIIVPVFYVR